MHIGENYIVDCGLMKKSKESIVPSCVQSNYRKLMVQKEGKYLAEDLEYQLKTTGFIIQFSHYHMTNDK